MSGFTEQLKNILRRSRTIYSLCKFTKRVNQVPLVEWTNIRRLINILKVLPNTMATAPGLINAYECMQTAEQEGIEGGVAECGVCSGGCIGLMALASKQFSNDKRVFHLFDSFQGSPQPSKHDIDVLDSFCSGHPCVEIDNGSSPSKLVPTDTCVGATLEQVEHFMFKLLQIDPKQVVFHRGWFQHTVPLAKSSIGPLAILRIEGDWYESTKVCIENLFDSVVDRGFIIIGDYLNFQGCQKALWEFFASRSLAPELVAVDESVVFFRK